MEMPEVLTAAKEYLDQLSEDDAFDVPTSLREGIEKAAADAKRELACNYPQGAHITSYVLTTLLAINTRIKDLTSNISSQFVDLRGLPYRLQSVFIHVGSATFGHYWIYIRDFERDVWRKYNDESVSAVTDLSQIFDQDPSDRPPTPYFLVYVKDDLKDRLVDPVCRDVPEQIPQELPQLQAVDNSDDLINDIVLNDAESSSSQQEGYQGTKAAIGNWFEADEGDKRVKW